MGRRDGSESEGSGHRSAHSRRLDSRDMHDRYGKSSRHRSRSPRPRRHRSRSRDKSRDRHRSRSCDKSRDRQRGSSQSRRRGRDKSRSSDRDRRRRSRGKSSSSQSSHSDSTVSAAEERSPSPTALLARLEAERTRKKEERRRQKELVKRLETPVQKRQRRLQKRVEKERIRKEKMGWDEEYLHYTNDDNPFGDSNLLDTFRWDKKLQRDGLEDIAKEELEKLNRLKMGETRRELEKVKARRVLREKEMAERDQATSLLQSKQEAEQFRAWEKQEDQFHLRQSRLRSNIRIQEGRAKPIDLLAKYIGNADELDAVEVNEPYNYLLGLSMADLEDLLEDIGVYEQLEQGANLDFWNDVTVVVNDELQQLRKLDTHQQQQAVVGRRDGIHESVTQDVGAVFRGKNAAQLATLQTQIELKLKNRLDGVDVGYWESLLANLKAYVARARLRDRHQANLREKLRLLKASQGMAEASTSAASNENPKSEAAVVDDSDDQQLQQSEQRTTAAADDEEEDDEEEDLLGACLREYSSGRYTPPLIEPEHLEPGTLINDPAEDAQRQEHARQTVLKQGGHIESAVTAEERALQREAKKGMEGDEVRFSVEADLGPQTHLWSDKYRPRKPRYFNRVHTGFEWNKYNQTHYDMDNPPPKVVQGYKFNIFYPDVIDKSATPEYTLTTCSDNRDFSLLTFHTGPPYEDIAFKIVNREWEYSYRRGFRCQFQNNIFQLWFHFKRYRYRR